MPHLQEAKGQAKGAGGTGEAELGTCCTSACLGLDWHLEKPQCGTGTWALWLG